MPQNKTSGIFPDTPGHVAESTPRRGRRRRNFRKRKPAPPSPLGQANSSIDSGFASPQTTSPEQRSTPLRDTTSREPDRPPHPLGLTATSGERAAAAAAESAAVMRKNLRVLEEVQACLEGGVDEVHTALAASVEQLSGLMEEVLEGQQQIMDMNLQIMERVMRIDRNIPVMK